MPTNISYKKWIPLVGCFLFLTVTAVTNAQASGYGAAASQPSTMAQQNQMSSKDGSAGSYMDNAVITAKVKAMLMKDEMLKSLDIHVDTKQDVVTLSGTVKNMKESERAVRIASAVEGVKMVKNELQQKTKK
ncbi:Transport-associated protein [Thiomonas sp. X19]|uniref:BON domain-containing protein n=1 Tax=Thiomonas sp. X19 TaxID=1050370 RepID=UPI000B628A66|nr:BON domain-containing protein [Thiomonas sp. X19]SCC94607.1 Transport-associated protein [Thiomonas sp. X19]